ncbi:MAG: prolyl oligopeptidase family serine peptidase [Bacteroidales bacterium]|jgi:prolyl oligopeptidase|nr:prolyl oligopeptidase family serine peptidase [Bacteroidales bacterium]
MKKINSLVSVAVLAVALFSCNNTKKIEAVIYPETKKGDVVDTYFDTEVADPYRWLEDDMSEETAQWVKAQNEVTFGYLNAIPYRGQIKDRLTDIFNYERVTAPNKHGDYEYYSKNDGLQDQSVIYRKKKGGEEEVFLDPNTFSEDGTTSLGGVSFTKDGSLMGYSISEGGSDWRKVIILEAESKKQVEKTLVDVKFSGISWRGNEGFYYSSYDKPEGSELSAKTDQHKLYFHKLGTPQLDDKVIFGADMKRRYVSGLVSENQRFLMITAANSTSGNELYVIDLEKENPVIKTLVASEDYDFYEVYADAKYIYIITNEKAPNYRLVRIPANAPDMANAEDLIPETKDVLECATGSGYLFAKYTADAITKMKQYNMDGTLLREVELPGVGTAEGFGGEKEDDDLYYSFTNYTTPGNIYKYNPVTGESELYIKPKIDFDSELLESKQVFYTSKDGTKVPMIITYKKGTKLNGKHPTILYGYGGFNIQLNPAFSSTRAVWMEMGGVYAVANLRGGGEYGKEWHDAGTKLKKQNVFDDFIAAAEYLIDEKYTSSDKLAIMGGSNGGLLVGATMTQRPDLMKVALPAVGVLDMLRYHTFTAGAGWAYDYGTAEDDKEMFEYLKGYSPVHNVKEGVQYPATLVTTGDHDDRVVPAHSFKFAAELQAKQAGSNPTLIRIETNAGHGAGTPISKTIEQYADIFAFTLWNMGVREVDN